VASPAATANEVTGHFSNYPPKIPFRFSELPFTQFCASKTDIIVIYWVMPVKKREEVYEPWHDTGKKLNSRPKRSFAGPKDSSERVAWA
jgi:hypothetical protein